MNEFDPKFTALHFNEFINRQDLQGLSGLMAEDHVMIDRAGEEYRGKETMVKAWRDFFQSFPDYRNTFLRIQSEGDLVVLYGYDTWQKGSEPDYAIWTARIENDLMAEWRIHEDTQENKKLFNLK